MRIGQHHRRRQRPIVQIIQRIGNLLIALTIDFDDPRHITLTLVRVIAGIGVGWIADGIEVRPVV